MSQAHISVSMGNIKLEADAPLSTQEAGYIHSVINGMTSSVEIESRDSGNAAPRRRMGRPPKVTAQKQVTAEKPVELPRRRGRPRKQTANGETQEPIENFRTPVAAESFG